MNHDIMIGPSGTFIGHFGPGIVFIALGLWWIGELIFKGPKNPGEPIERSLIIPVLKLFSLLIGGSLEMPNSGWLPMDWVMGWHHITVYFAFALSGIVDIMARKEILSARATHLAFAGASLIGALLFFGHGIGPGVEGIAHTIVMIMFFSISFFIILELVKPDWHFEWYRIAAMIGLGIWMCTTAWMLFMSGWDLHDHISEAHVWLRFSWVILFITTFSTSASILVAKRWP